ncbi:hypothetical protein C5167_004674 [Papaver somniferum]|uniref:ATP-dependent DNA helicase n=1 Tax=Papaver somniferum TaxID=3469 RepID=A0A4Y7J8A3_PAPSO|nr:uncharacterized protein LOC113273555 [Papaver somniferum]XP_026379021.1 uncharacterized protein LOC113273555 [Papaver somniferum]RZC57373.1 hypothetical protein C5167_004674 [Papaver somniferum]
MGLCNGTQLVVKQIGKRFIEGQIITGNSVGFHVCIPRMIFSPTGANLPFVFRRRQFPVKVCFAMTINKIQVQTLQQVGIYLPKPLFTHGQLYMAVSITTSKEGLKILIKKSDKQPLGFTQNIVYKEVFNNLHPGFIQVVDTPTRMPISETTKSNTGVLGVVETGIGTAISETPMRTAESQNRGPSKVAEIGSNNTLDDEGHPKKKRLLFHLHPTSGGCSTDDS